VLQGTIVDAIAMDAVNVNHIFRLHLDTAQANLPAGADVYLKVKVLGPGTQPSTVRLSIATDYAEVNDKRITLNSNEIVQTIRSSSSAPGGPAIPFTLIPGTKLSFTSTTAANAVVSAAAPAAAPSTSAPTTTAGAEPAAPAAALTPSTAAAPRTRAAQGQVDRQQQIAERQKLAQKYAACQQQAIKAHPEDRAELAKAYTACIQGK
jgi:hypothetical protein